MLQETDNRILQVFNISNSWVPFKILGQGKYTSSLVVFAFGSIVLRLGSGGHDGKFRGLPNNNQTLRNATVCGTVCYILTCYYLVLVLPTSYVSSFDLGEGQGREREAR